MNTQQSPHIQLSQTFGYVCSNCGHNIFEPKIMVRKVSRFVTGESTDSIIPIDIIVCDNCKEVAKDLLPPQVTSILFPDVSND